MLNLFCTSVCFFSDLSQAFSSACALAVHRLVVVVALQNLSNEEQVVVIHARTVLTLAEKVSDLLKLTFGLFWKTVTLVKLEGKQGNHSNLRLYSGLMQKES